MRRLVLAIVLFVGAAAASADAPAPAPAPQTERTVEIERVKPSGFWGTGRRSVGGAYRYRLLGIGIVLALGTGLVMRRLVKRANAERAARATRSPGA